MLGDEVADADRADGAVHVQRSSSALYASIVRSKSVVRGWWRITRSIVSSSSFSRPSSRRHAAVSARPVVGDPDLRLDEDLLARDAGAHDRLADTALVAVGRSGVDVPVAHAQGFADGLLRLLRRGLEDAGHRACGIRTLWWRVKLFMSPTAGAPRGEVGVPVGIPWRRSSSASASGVPGAVR